MQKHAQACADRSKRPEPHPDASRRGSHTPPMAGSDRTRRSVPGARSAQGTAAAHIEATQAPARADHHRTQALGPRRQRCTRREVCSEEHHHAEEPRRHRRRHAPTAADRHRARVRP